MSPQDLSSQPRVAAERKLRMNIYMVMLLISLFCIITACVLLYLELRTYGAFPWWRVPSF